MVSQESTERGTAAGEQWRDPEVAGQAAVTALAAIAAAPGYDERAHRGSQPEANEPKPTCGSGRLAPNALHLLFGDRQELASCNDAKSGLVKTVEAPNDLSATEINHSELLRPPEASP
jgi:hypothetical protein